MFKLENQKFCYTEQNSTTTQEPCENIVNQASQVAPVGNKNWCVCGLRRIEEREIDCLCCRAVTVVKKEIYEGKYAKLMITRARLVLKMEAMCFVGGRITLKTP